MVNIANRSQTSAASLFAERDARLARLRSRKTQDHGAVLKTPRVEERRSLKGRKEGKGKKVSGEDHSLKTVGQGRSLEKLVEGLSLKEKVEVKEVKKKVRVEVRSLSLKKRAEELALKQGRDVEVVFVEEAAEEEHSLKQQQEEQSIISTLTWQRFEEGIARSFQRTFDNATADFALSLKKKGDELSLKWKKQVEEKVAKKAALEDQSLKQHTARSFVSTRQKVPERRTRSLQKILDDARDEFPWPDVSDIPAELGPVPRLPYAQSSKTMEVLAVTYCGAAWRLANVRLGDVIDAGMPGFRLDYHKTDGRHSLE